MIGTNATMINNDVAQELKSSGVSGVGVSLDSIRDDTHDKLRGVDGSFDTALRGIEALNNVKIPFQTQFSITKDNILEIEGFARFSKDLGASVVNYFFLVCTGRG